MDRVITLYLFHDIISHEEGPLRITAGRVDPSRDYSQQSDGVRELLKRVLNSASISLDPCGFHHDRGLYHVPETDIGKMGRAWGQLRDHHALWGPLRTDRGEEIAV